MEKGLVRTINDGNIIIIEAATQFPNIVNGITSGGTISGMYIQMKGPKDDPKFPIYKTNEA